MPFTSIFWQNEQEKALWWNYTKGAEMGKRSIKDFKALQDLGKVLKLILNKKGFNHD